jgi:tetratricopeptide (TPR) repeat protein
LLGLSLGAQAGLHARKVSRGVRLALGLPGLLIWPLWAIAGPVTGGGGTALAAAVVGFGVLAWLTAAFPGEAGDQAAFCLGGAAGFAACSAGLPGLIGLVPVAIIAAAAAAGAALLGRDERAELGDARTAAPPALLLGGAAGAAAFALLRGYMPAVRCAAYAASDLAVAFLCGWLVSASVLRRRAGDTMLPVSLAAVTVLCSVAGFSFFLYPDALVSEPAVRQASCYLLGAGRVFPLWLWAFALGAFVGPALADAEGATGIAPILLMSAGAGAAAAGLLGSSPRGPYVLAAALAVLGLVTVCRSEPARRTAGGRFLCKPLLAVGLAGLLWCILADPHGGWAGLRRSASGALSRWGGAAGASVTVLDGGARVLLEASHVQAEFWDGDMVQVRRNGSPTGAPAAELAVALAVAHSGDPVRIGIVRPALADTVRLVQLLAAPAQVAMLDLWGGAGSERLDAIICDAGPMSLAACPLSVLSQEGLARVRGRLAAEGVFALWLPAVWVDVETMRGILASVSSAFPHFALFLTGDEAVLVAGETVRWEFAPLQRLFDQGEGVECLAKAGFWEPIDLLLEFAASSDELGYAWAGVRPYALRHPCRPPAVARDLEARTRPASLALLAQHRLAGPGRAANLLEFAGRSQGAVALRGFDELYGQRTGELLRGAGRSSALGKKELIAFLQGPLVRAELFAPGETDKVMRLAAVLGSFRLDEEAMGVLEASVEAGRDSFEVQSRLAGLLESLQRPGEALSHYQRALAYQPDSMPTLRRIAGLQLMLGQHADAAETLRKVLEHEPGNTSTLLMLGNLYAAKLGRFRDAAALAARVLELDPHSAEAQQLLVLSRDAMRSAGQ